MATKTIADRGAEAAIFIIEPRGSAALVTVRVALSTGVQVDVGLTGPQIAAVLNASQRTALRAALDALYGAALTVEGFA